jgi:integrase/recombinase XerC
MMTNTELVKIEPAGTLERTGRLVESFLSGRNARTLVAYRQDLEDFRAFVKAEDLDQAARLLLSRGHGEANGLALDYKSSLLERGLQAATVNRRLAALRSLVKLSRTLGMVPWFLEVENVPAESYRDTRGPGKTGFAALLDQAVQVRNRKKAVRDRAVLRLLYDLALRRGELVALDLGDVDLPSGTVAILGKGRSQKELLTLPEPTKNVLAEWLETRGPEPGPLFVNLDRAGKGDGRLTGNGLFKIVRGLGQRKGLKVRPHGLRHSGITAACKAAQANGMDLEEVMDFSRHKSVRTLMVYRDRERNVQGQIAALVAAGA